MWGVGAEPAGLGQVVGEVRGQERGSYREASYLGESSELEAQTVIRYVTTAHLCKLTVLEHLEDTIYRISKIKENDRIKTTDKGAMEKELLNTPFPNCGKPPGDFYTNPQDTHIFHTVLVLLGTHSRELYLNTENSLCVR